MWTQQNSVSGLLFTGKDAYSSNSIFLPATGLKYFGSGNVGQKNESAYYWSGSGSYLLYFSGGSHTVGEYVTEPEYGRSVRAVLNE